LLFSTTYPPPLPFNSKTPQTKGLESEKTHIFPFLTTIFCDFNFEIKMVHLTKGAMILASGVSNETSEAARIAEDRLSASSEAAKD